jgi:hypothetical protein
MQEIERVERRKPASLIFDLEDVGSVPPKLR